ncbi:MAG TPA: S8 family serine peptidase, partial [Thermoanaerobaculia bacterium]|nr:S8 family serine peptidase [Thermoanaerobaculia bacterium]
MNEKLERRRFIEKLMFGTGRVRRFTQDSPVLPDVWLAYAEALEDDTYTKHDHVVQLLLTPYRDKQTGEVRNAVLERLRAEHGKKKTLPRVIYNQATVAAELTFEELVRVVIPLTGWWENLTRRFDVALLQEPPTQKLLARAIRNPEDPRSELDLTKKGAEKVGELPPDALWLVRIVGALKLYFENGAFPNLFDGGGDDVWLAVIKTVAALLRGVPEQPPEPYVFVASLNRAAWPTISRSALAIKADAARQLFNISCRDVRWAVLDSGIDARHPAFRARENGKMRPKPFAKVKGKWANHTRIVATYDFSEIDKLLDPHSDDFPARIEAMRNMSGETARRVQEQIDTLNESLKKGRSIDWGLVAPLVEIPHDDTYARYAPRNDHGTHVAGILAGDMRENDKDPLETN